MSVIETKLAELGVTLPDAPAPAANYVPFVISGAHLYVSGQVSAGPDGLVKGRLGETVSLEDSARSCQGGQKRPADRSVCERCDRIADGGMAGRIECGEDAHTRFGQSIGCIDNAKRGFPECDQCQRCAHVIGLGDLCSKRFPKAQMLQRGLAICPCRNRIDKRYGKRPVPKPVAKRSRCQGHRVRPRRRDQHQLGAKQVVAGAGHDFGADGIHPVGVGRQKDIGGRT